MVKYCCVPGCLSDNRKTSEKISFFSVPKCEELQAKWKAAIGSETNIRAHSLVCEKHFRVEDVKSTWESGAGTSKVCINLNKVRLKPGAVPSVFPDPPAKKTIKLDCTADLAMNIVEEDSTFELLASTPPPNGWSKTTIYEDHSKEASFFFVSDGVPSADGECHPLTVVKELRLRSDLKLIYFMMGENISPTKYQLPESAPTNKNDFEKLLDEIDQRNICIGGPKISEYKRFSVVSARRNLGIWRHMKCPVLLGKTTRKCTSCHSIKYCLKSSMKRAAENKNIRLKGLSPKKQRSLQHLRSSKMSLTKSKERREKE